MNKQKLIDMAVEQFCGKYPAKYPENIILSYRDGCEKRRNSYYPFYVCHSESEYDICTKDEFEKRARELGWINGYKYGVEYETNGKRPNLDNDVLVEFFGVGNEWSKPDKLVNWAWDLSKKFRIVDKRYKPVESVASNEVEQVQDDWYDYDKQRAIVLPPVGEKIEFNYQTEKTWETSYVVAIHYYRKDLILAPFNSSGKLIYADDLDRMRPLDWNRKADEERQKFVDDALACLTEFRSANQVFAELYDAGCRFTENKAAS